MKDGAEVNPDKPDVFAESILDSPREHARQDATFTSPQPRPRPGRWPASAGHTRENATSAARDFWSLLEPSLHRWPWVIIAGTGATGLGLLLALTLWHTRYFCTAQLIRYDPPVATDAFKPQPLATQTLVSMIMSPDLLQQVGAKFNPPLSGRQLASRLSLMPERNPDIVTLTAWGGDPHALAGLINQFDQGAIQFTQEVQRKEAVEADAYVAQQLAKTESDLAMIRHEMPATVQTPLDPSAPPDNLAEKIRAAREELANLLLSYTEAHPLVREQRAKLAALSAQMAEEADAQKRSGGGNAPAVQSRPAQSASDAAPLPATPRENYEVMLDRLRILEANHAALVDRQRAIQVFKANPPGYFRILLAAREQDAVIKRPWLKISVFALFCGLLGAIGATGEALFIELLDNRLKTVTDVKRVTRLPLLATLGDLRILPPDRQDNWAFRTWLALQDHMSPHPNYGLVCGITSANTGDGRSTWVRLLARAASQHGFRVLTITTKSAGRDEKNGESEPEAQSTTELAFPSPESKALTAVALTTPAEVAEKLMSSESPPMVHIPLPGWVWNMERRKQWQTALNLWRKIENVVIFVELPPASVPEAVLLAENLPNLIWLAESGKSNASETAQQLETLRHARCNLVGAVLNRAPRPMVNGRFTRWLGSWAVVLALGVLHGGLRADEISAPTAADASQESTAGTFSVAPPVQRAAWQQRLTLGPGDLLNIHFFGEPDLSREGVPVGPDGRISYLEAQNVPAAGLTVDELRDRLDQALGQYRRAPQVFVVPAAFRSKKYFMLGNVVQKGVFTLDRPITIVEAVARAHGFETDLTRGNVVELADLSRSFLARQGRHMPVDFEKLFLAGDLSQNIPIEPDDYLYFPAGDLKEVYVLGEVTLPGPLAFNPETTALEAVAARGGFTEHAWKQHLLVVRGSLNHPETFVVDAADVLSAKTPDFKLQPRDIVYVSSRPWIRAEELLDTAATAFVESAVVTWTGLHVTTNH
jgi:protein involved in polysaccharide export with SLBB domain/capsular polysaccharide biosynthesis protein